MSTLTHNAFRVEGHDQAVELLKDFSTRDQKKELIAIMRKAVRPIPRDAKARLGGYSNRVARSIKAFQPRGATRRDNPVLFVGVKSNWRGYGDPNDPWFAHIIEGGASGIKRDQQSRRGPGTDDDKMFRVRAAQTPKGGRYRVDQKPRPFFHPAVEANQERVARILLSDMSDEILKRIERKKRK